MADDSTSEPASRSRATLAQRIAQREAQLAKLKQQQQQHSRKLATREKIIIGGAIVAAARANPELRRVVGGILQQHVTKDLDREVVTEWLSHT